MPVALDLTVTLIDNAWHVERPDGYRLVFAKLDRSRPGVWRAETSACIQDTWLTTATIDVLNLRDREQFHIAASSVNGQGPVMWAQFLQHGYLIVEEELAQEAEAVNSQLDASLFADAPSDSMRVSGVNSLNSLNSHLRYPVLAPEAWHGVAGKLVQTIAPQSESDPVALLAQCLTYVGAVMGNAAYYQVEATRHHTNLAMVCVGETSKGRKGTAYDHIEMQMRTVDPAWNPITNVTGGCGSGEGLIAAVRDRTTKREPIKVKGKVTGYQEVEADAGVSDKRLLVYESEFASVLKVATREGNLLSVVIRQAWESGHLRNTVKNNPLKATGAHIAFIGHITREELQRLLTTTEVANGFGNRFLWLCVQRSQCLPDGGDLSAVDFQPMLKKLRAAVTTAHHPEGRMQRDADATVAWHAVYPQLSAGKPGLGGALLARGEAQVLRLSMIYALLDGAHTIRLPHLYAALALWQYVEDSITYLYGQTTGNPLADTILAALDVRDDAEITKKQLSDEILQRHHSAEKITGALSLLRDGGYITLSKGASAPGGGRPPVYIKRVKNCELSELTLLHARSYIAIARAAVGGSRINAPAVAESQECELSELSEQTPASLSNDATNPQNEFCELTANKLRVNSQAGLPPCGHDPIYYEHQSNGVVCCTRCGWGAA